jgi:hypothetical protein
VFEFLVIDLTHMCRRVCPHDNACTTSIYTCFP